MLEWLEPSAAFHRALLPRATRSGTVPNRLSITRPHPGAAAFLTPIFSSAARRHARSKGAQQLSRNTARNMPIAATNRNVRSRISHLVQSHCPSTVATQPAHISHGSGPKWDMGSMFCACVSPAAHDWPRMGKFAPHGPSLHLQGSRGDNVSGAYASLCFGPSSPLPRPPAIHQPRQPRPPDAMPSRRVHGEELAPGHSSLSSLRCNALERARNCGPGLQHTTPCGTSGHRAKASPGRTPCT